jgi:hypothetical protein
MKFVSIAFTFSSTEKNECVTRFDNGWILSTIGFGYFHERLVNAALNATDGKSGKTARLILFVTELLRNDQNLH